MINNKHILNRTPIVFYLAFLAFAGCSAGSDNKTAIRESISDSDKSSDLSEKDLEQAFYDEAMDAYKRELFSISEKKFEDLRNRFPGSSYYPEAILKIADGRFYSGKFPEAVAAYQEYIELYPLSNKVAWAELQIANCHLEQFRDSDRDQQPLHAAAEVLKKFLKKYPSAEYGEVAWESLKKAIENKAAYEAGVVEFYLKQKKISSASARLANIRKNFAGTSAAKSLEFSLEEKYPDLLAQIDALAEIQQISDEKLFSLPNNSEIRFAEGSKPNKASSRSQLKPESLGSSAKEKDAETTSD